MYNMHLTHPEGAMSTGLTLTAGDQLQILGNCLLAIALWSRVRIGESTYLCMFLWCEYLEEINASPGGTCKLHREVLPQRVLNLGPSGFEATVLTMFSAKIKMLLFMHCIYASAFVSHCILCSRICCV